MPASGGVLMLDLLPYVQNNLVERASDVDWRLVRKVATALRYQLGYCNLGCERAARELTKRLRGRGIDAHHWYGHVEVDGNFDEQWGSGPVSWYQDDPTVERWLDHHWVMVGDTVVDIGAEQFNPLLKDEEFPAVYIGPAHRFLKAEEM